MADNKLDWNHFVVRISIRAQFEILYHAWATRDRIEYWFLRLSEYKASGGSLRQGNELVEK